MKIKRILMVSCLASGLLLTACGPKSSGGGSSGPIPIDPTVPEEARGTYAITMWGSEVEGVEELFKKQIQDFCKLNPGLTINVTYEAVSEKDSAAKVLADVDAAADLYCFAQDQFADLVQGAALTRLGKVAQDAITANNDAGSVAAVTSGDYLYAYPMTADNGYFMYYDNTVVKANHLNSLEDILADCVAAERTFSMETSTSAWYIASFFFGTGCVSEWTTNDEGDFVSANDTFNSPQGLIAMRGMQHLVKSEYYVSSSNAAEQFAAARQAAVVVSGTWDYDKAVEALGEKLGVAELPSFTVDGQSYHLGSYSGNKLLGVKPTTDVKRARVLSTLALYLTSQDCQEERFDAVSWGPSNKVVAQMDKVTANPALAALLKQAQYAKPQGQIPGAWWDFAKVLGTVAAEAAQDDTTALQAGLTTYAEAIDKVLHPTETPVWALVGSFAGKDSSWNAASAYRMTEGESGKWSVTVSLAANDEFKVCKINSTTVLEWKYGASGVDQTASTAAAAFDLTGDNIKVLTSGSYLVVMTGTGVELRSAIA